MRRSFDILIEHPLHHPAEPVRTIGQILFETIPGRDENCNIILSHIENEYREISLFRLRAVAASLIKSFSDRNIRKGQTVVLLTFHGCNEMFTAICFLVLASMGCRVFMPMYSEMAEFSNWMDLTGATHIILPEGEVLSLEGHEKEKLSVKEIRDIASRKGIKIWDSLADFDLAGLLQCPVNQLINPDVVPAQPDIVHVKLDTVVVKSEDQPIEPSATGPVDLQAALPDDEVLIVTTSGTSGRSRLVVYTHRAYYLNCLAWGEAGFFKPEHLGGTGFTPLIAHTMGIRAFVNALWTGVPVCLIITDWFIEKPEIVSYLLLRMKPAHITGGPAVYNAFIELFRVYPEFKTSLVVNFKTLVSSGASYNPVTAKEISDATGLPLHNAFGTTETQQVLSTLLSPPSVFLKGMIPLGKPLPGVSVGLVRAGNESNTYRLFLKSLFGHKKCLGEEEIAAEDFYDTGDIVLYEDNENLFYVGRASSDYFKDSFGVKIPISSLRDYYGEMLRQVLHAEFYPIINFPGISALLFIREPEVPSGMVSDSSILKKYSGIVEGINNRLMHSLDTFEFQHRQVCRIALMNQKPPLTGKGSISARQIAITCRDVIDRLTDARKESTGIEITERLYQITDKYTRFISPLIGSLLSALKMNVSYHRGVKDSLFTYIRGKETEVLDLAGGYGTNFTGHHHPVISKAAVDFIDSGQPAICNQLSIQQTSGLLAEKLNLMIGAKTGRGYQVILASTGSEAVEIALHHAFFEWKKRIEKFRDQQIQLFGSDKELNVAAVWKSNMKMLEQAVVRVIGLPQGFHGHSTGARTMLGNWKKKYDFRQLSRIEPLFIDDRTANWQESLDCLTAESIVTIQKVVKENGGIGLVPHKISTVIAAIAEPVIGEGGVRVVDREFLKQLASYEFPLISDEIQCGMGRTGNIPEFEKAHYYLFGKALGGGIEKIAAVLVDRTRYCNEFGEHYVSTFGNGEMAANVALTTLQVIENENLSQLSADAGFYLHQQLSAIRDKYPDVILDIRGKGLMQAICFNPACTSNKIVLRVLFQTEKAGYLFAAWFFNRHRIRIFPTLSAPNTLRIEASAYFTRTETDRLCHALEELCLIIKEMRFYDLFSFLMDDDHFIENHESRIPLDHYHPTLEAPAEGAVKVAFIAHFVFPVKELRMLEADLERASDTGLRILFKRLQLLMEMKPVTIMACNLFNNKVHFSFHIIPVDSAELEFLHKSGKRRNVVSKIQEAVDLAAANGAGVISLGGYTSILTSNGLSLAEPEGSRIITGNTLTAASGLMHLGKTMRQKPEFNKPNDIAIIGSTGNIGRIVAEILCEQDDICGNLLLVSRKEKGETELISELIRKKSGKTGVRSTTSLSEIKNADVIIICTNTNDPIIFPHHISGDKPVLISDLSVPSAVSEEVNCLPNVTVLPFAAYVSLREDRDVVISSYSPPGTVFCCAGEAILLGLEKCDEPLKGKIQHAAVQEITRLASGYGFFHDSETMKSYKTAKK